MYRIIRQNKKVTYKRGGGVTQAEYRVTYECGHASQRLASEAPYLSRFDPKKKTVRAWCHDCDAKLWRGSWGLVYALCRVLSDRDVPPLDMRTVAALAGGGWRPPVDSVPSGAWWDAAVAFAQEEEKKDSFSFRTPKHQESVDDLWRATRAEVVALADRGALVGCQPIPLPVVWEGLRYWAPEPLTPFNGFQPFHILAGLDQPKRARTKKVTP